MQHPVRGFACALVALAALIAPTAALAHAQLSPPIVVAKTDQVFTLAVPTEKEGATTTKLELTVPDGFNIDSFEPVAGWTRSDKASGTGDAAHITSVTWTTTQGPTTEEAAMLRFIAAPDETGTYRFDVKQTYSSGEVVEWTGNGASDTPAAEVVAKSSLGGGGSDTLAIVALVVGALGLLVGVGGITLGRGGKRSLA